MNAITKNPLALTLATAIIYHFRGMALDAKDRTKAQSADLAAHPDAFEIVESRIKQADGTIAKIKQHKRKSFTANVQYPDFLINLEDAALQVLVKQSIDRYVKLQFVDEFKEVGPHDWATVSSAIVDAYNNASAGSAPDDTVLAAAQLVWNTVIVQLAPALAATSADWIAKGCTDAGIRKMLGGNVTEPRLRKIAERVQQVAAVLATPEGADFANAAPAFAYASDRIESIIGKMATLDDDAL